MSDEKIIITADQAIAMLPEGEYVHNYTMGAIMIGIDYDRPGAEKAIRDAVQIEIGGPGCIHMRHPLVVWDKPNHCTAFQADMDKFKAFMAERETA